MDREFFAVDIMNMLDEAGIAFTIPAIKTLGVKNAINEFKQGVRDVVSRHSITSAEYAFRLSVAQTCASRMRSIS